MKFQLKTAILMVLAFVFVACKKDDPTEAELMAGTWVIQKKEARDNASISKNWSDVTPLSCELDDEFTFGIDSTYGYKENALSCDTVAPQTLVGNWRVLTNTTTLEITYANGGYRFFKIDQLTEANLVLIETDEPVVFKDVRYTLKKK
jgi:Lipocalin-like domain